MQVFTVELAEGGTGVVHAGDPAYHICQDLQRAGYNQLVLTIPILATGDSEAKGLMSEELDLLRLAAVEDQMQAIEQVPETACTHHWIIEESGSAEEGTFTGSCKFCDAEAVFPADPKVDYSKRRGSISKAQKAVWEDWRERLSQAEAEAGLKSSLSRD